MTHTPDTLEKLIRSIVRAKLNREFAFKDLDYGGEHWGELKDADGAKLFVDLVNNLKQALSQYIERAAQLNRIEL